MRNNRRGNKNRPPNDNRQNDNVNTNAQTWAQWIRSRNGAIVVISISCAFMLLPLPLTVIFGEEYSDTFSEVLFGTGSSRISSLYQGDWGVHSEAVKRMLMHLDFFQNYIDKYEQGSETRKKNMQRMYGSLIKRSVPRFDEEFEASLSVSPLHAGEKEKLNELEQRPLVGFQSENG